MRVNELKRTNIADELALAIRALRSDLFPRDHHERTLALNKARMAIQSFYAGMSAMPIMILIIAAIGSFWSPPTTTLCWAAVSLLLWGYCWLGAVRMLSGHIKDEDVARVLQRAYSRLALFALLFASHGVLFWTPGEPLNHMCLTMIMLGSALAGGMIAAWQPYAQIQAIASMGVIIFNFACEGDVYLMMIGMAVMFAVFLTGVISTMHAYCVRLLSLESSKDDLILRLRTSNQAKTDFLAHMSHELRTPLNAILGFSEVIKEEMIGPNHQPAYKGYASDIHSAGTHLLTLINDILDVSKIEAGKFELRESVADAGLIAKDALRILNLRATQNGVNLVNVIPIGLKLWCDAGALKQIILNLASNALKFTPAGGQVHLSFEMSGGTPVFVVRDSGCGIRKEDLKRVFETFGQGRHDVSAPREKGTGLGLPIVRGLAQAHGGDVTLESEVGKGTTVRVTLSPARLRQVPDKARIDAA
jgi:two-component system, cell cycle sensor histidine kinase PleC